MKVTFNPALPTKDVEYDVIGPNGNKFGIIRFNYLLGYVFVADNSKTNWNLQSEVLTEVAEALNRLNK